MLNPNAALMARLLGVAAPWAVTDASASAATRTVTVRIERPQPRAGLFARRAASPARRQLAWDHVAVFGWRCRVLLVLHGDEAAPEALWTGEPDQTWTRGLQRVVMDLLLAGATVEQLAVLLGLPFGEVWRWKFRLDQGGQGARRRPVGASGSPADGDGVLPDPTDPLWMALLDGSRELDVRVLGLRLLLARLRAQIRSIGDDEVRMVKLVELHRYFTRNQATLGHEIAQIRAWH